MTMSTRGSLAVIALAVMALPATARAFSSYGQGAHHFFITRDAAQAKGFPDSTAKLLADVAQAPDWLENGFSIRTGPYVKKDLYVAVHHFDRNIGVTDANAFTGGAAYMRARLQNAIDAITAGQNRVAYDSLGNCIHALEDCFSHSNFVDLTPADQQKVIDALFDGTKVPPATLWMTGYDATAAKDESPPNDPHPHLTMAKDWSDKNAEAQLKIGQQTKFALARAAAETQVEAVLDRIKAAVTGAQWDSFRGTPAGPDPLLSEYDWECAEFCPPTGCNFGCFDAAVGGDDLHLDLPDGALAAPDSLSLIGFPARCFLTADMLVAGDGAQVIPGWEIKVGEFELNGSFPYPGTATAAIPDSDLAAFPGDTWGVYFMDQSAEEWVRVGNATIDLGAGRATFPVAGAGIFAPGHLPGTSPVRGCMVEADVAPEWIDIRWFAGSDAAGPFRVLRSSGGDGGYCIVHEEPPAASQQIAFTYRDRDVVPSTEYSYEVAVLEGANWIASTPVSATTAAAGFALQAPVPNPSEGGARIDFNVPKEGAAVLDVLDAQGRVVRRILNGRTTIGAHSVRWDGRAESGRRMSPGIYFLRLQFEGRTLSRSAVVTGQ
jgi:hypothetical protein